MGLEQGASFVFFKNNLKRGLVIGNFHPLPHVVRRVCFYGPESTGKSVMAKHLAEVYNTEYVPEVARAMITSNKFTVEDIVKIAYAQTQCILERTKTANKILFCDTDLITTQIYSAYYLHEVPPILYELEKQVTYDLYFLFDIDVPWVSDGLRDLGADREAMYTVFKSALEDRKISFVRVHGNHKEREKCIRGKIDLLLKING
jgi:HTH-type transcriptional regulator, transcriptional repressor of NAD biosynthesis genes